MVSTKRLRTGLAAGGLAAGGLAGKQIELIVHDPDGVRIHVDQRPD